MNPVSWPCPAPAGDTAGEYAIAFDQGRPIRLLVIPALFDEANRLRRLAVEVMRRLDQAGIDSFLPDFPGTNESLQPLEGLEPVDWHRAMAAAARHFAATHTFAMRGGCLFAPAGLPSLHYAPIDGAAVLRPLMRARVLTAREAGREETRESLAARAEQEGIELAGYRLSARFFQNLRTLQPAAAAVTIAQESIGGGGLWRGAEPGDDPAQAEALARTVAQALA